MAPIRVGIIGLGASAELKITGSWGVFAHLRSIQALSGEYELVAVANSTVESAQRSIDFHKLPNTTKAYGNANDIAADPNVDLVVISVTVSRHHSLAMAVLKHKKSLFIEWPLAATVEEAEDMTRLASENGVRAIVALQGRSDPLVQKLKDVLASGKIGRLVSSTVVVCSSALPVDQWMQGDEFVLDWKSGQNEYDVLFGHFIDSFTYVLGDFSQVQAQVSTKYKTIPIVDSSGQVVDPEYPKTSPDHIFVQSTLDNEAVISIAFRKSASAADGVGYRWYITGTLGELAITNSEAPWAYGVTASRKILLKLGKEGVTEEVDYTSEDTSRAANLPIPTRNTARIYENFAREGGEVVTFEDALKTHRLLARIAESAGWEM